MPFIISAKPKILPLRSVNGVNNQVHMVWHDYDPVDLQFHSMFMQAMAENQDLTASGRLQR